MSDTMWNQWSDFFSAIGARLDAAEPVLAAVG
jgi:hypothetical protein